jgi:ribosome modulation factor
MVRKIPNDSLIWVEGVHAFFEGRKRHTNPHKLSADRQSWAAGWDTACIVSDPKNPNIGVDRHV